MNRRSAKRDAILDTAYRLFRTQGFDKTSVSQITTEVGGSKATIYSHFPSKEDLFLECMVGAAEEYISGAIAQLDASRTDPESVLRNFGVSFLRLICSADMVAVRRLMIAEAERSDIGKLFFTKIISLRAHVAAFLSNCMALGVLRTADPQLAAEHLRALLEADLAEPLLLRVLESAPDEKELALAVDRAVFTFLKAYAPD
ncbi:TetR/AcrR family transcriptional regulator [Pseudomonas sp. ZT5P21]